MEIFLVILGILTALVASTFGGVQGKARDTERQTDIKALHGQIEAYYAQNGYYPSLTSMNDSNWRSQNLQGLDQEALKDPDGAGAVLKSKPTKDAYSYEVTDSSGKACSQAAKNCAKYLLTATLGDGKIYSKENLN